MSVNAPKIAIEVPRLPFIIIITAITSSGNVAKVVRNPLVVCEVFMWVIAMITPSSRATPAQISPVVILSPVVVESNIELNIIFLS